MTARTTLLKEVIGEGGPVSSTREARLLCKPEGEGHRDGVGCRWEMIQVSHSVSKMRRWGIEKKSYSIWEDDFSLTGGNLQ